MKFWQIDLTTRDGAENAAKSGAHACFLIVAMTVLLAAFTFLSAASTQDPVLLAAMIAGIALEGGVILIAGLRLRIGKGLYWGGAAVILMAIELLSKVVSLSPGAIVTGLLLIVLVNGVRGAHALRRDIFAEEMAGVFD